MNISKRELRDALAVTVSGTDPDVLANALYRRIAERRRYEAERPWKYDREDADSAVQRRRV